MPDKRGYAPRRQGILFKRLCDPKELSRAWQEVLAHYSSVDIPEELRAFDRHRGQEIAQLARDLHGRTFLPEPASLISIPKPNKPGERRSIALVTPADRIVLTSLNRLLDPLFERQFPAYSFAYRKGRGGAGAAVERVSHCLSSGLDHAACGDIEDFFGSIDRARLLDRFRKTVWEQPIVDLVETYLHMGAAAALEWVDTGKGIAQGSPLSPLLSNLYLLEFDHHLDTLGVEWIRYADNFVLLAPSMEQVCEAFTRAGQFLNGACQLQLNSGSGVFASQAEGFEFLGFRFQNGQRLMDAARLEGKKQRLTEMTRINSDDLKKLVRDVAETARGWRNYYGREEGARSQLGVLEGHLLGLLIPWMDRYRREGSGRGVKGSDLKSLLLDIELPREGDPRKKAQWVDLLLARSRPRAPEPGGPRSEQAKQAVEVRRRELRKKKEELEEILVTQPGSYLGRTGERLLIRRDGRREAEIPLSMIRNISVLTTAMSISGELMIETAARGISVHILGGDGKPVVRIGPADAPQFQLSVAQTRLASSMEGLALARRMIAGKVQNQVNLLRYAGKSKDGDSTAGVAVAQMIAIIEKLETGESVGGGDLELERSRLFAAEGQAASIYWGVMKLLFRRKKQPIFTGRVRKGASDPVNVMLNYGYGILYSRLLGLLVRMGLNISIGFLHKPQLGKPALLFDFIEEFRPAAVDRVVLAAVNLGKPMDVADGRLANESRQELARAVIKRLQSGIRYHGESVPLQTVMLRQAEMLVRHIEGKEDYRPFVMPW